MLSTVNVFAVGVVLTGFPAASVPVPTVTVAVPFPVQVVPAVYVHIVEFAPIVIARLLTTVPPGATTVIFGVTVRFSLKVKVMVWESPFFNKVLV